MLESDTQRSAAFTRKRERLAASLGFRPRGTSYCFWRFCSHVALFIGIVISLVFISPVSAVWRWKERRRFWRKAADDALVTPRADSRKAGNRWGEGVSRKNLRSSSSEQGLINTSELSGDGGGRVGHKLRSVGQASSEHASSSSLHDNSRSELTNPKRVGGSFEETSNYNDGKHEEGERIANGKSTPSDACTATVSSHYCHQASAEFSDGRQQKSSSSAEFERNADNWRRLTWTEEGDSLPLNPDFGDDGTSQDFCQNSDDSYSIGKI
eukprot:Plantae.Rhodophyta-Palmaria_palmata.ctg21627.p1 GENE.Plantae.Rhodophyta-Palmaria_palmata.ctg21627~~Plantae.Rhodophyta-Palmaria_palmata.ctg21627.p1  ORF type:complete len:278 (-),score=28.75 Plantae.Rhodophyta-Palmaria_palmata.ctg21627:430-1233(-)